MYEPSFAVAPSPTHLDSPFPDRSAQSAQVFGVGAERRRHL